MHLATLRKEDMLSKVCVIGHFAFEKNLLNGQTVKTKIITQELERQLGECNVLKIDTHGGKKEIARLVFKVGNTMKHCENAVMLPAQNGVRFFAPLLCFWKKIYHKKIHYIVIGGWLPELLKSQYTLQKYLKYFDGIYVETKTMKCALEKIGLKNVFVMANCKKVYVLPENKIKKVSDETVKLCTFSRVMREKGIEDAISVVKKINEEHGQTLYSLDIYGQIDKKYEERFDEIKKQFPDYIQYMGEVPYNQTTCVLKKYDILLFPTRFYTEGVPGTIIDAYASGLPVIASRWESFSDLIIEGKTGYGFSFGDIIDFEKKLEYARKVFECESNRWNQIRLNCLKQAKNYIPRNAMHIFIEQLDI